VICALPADEPSAGRAPPFVLVIVAILYFS